MARLFDRIRQLIERNRYVIGLHASERLEERGIMEWQAVDGISSATLLSERIDATPNPAVEIVEALPDGTEFKAVWSLLKSADVAKLVTVHYFDEP